MANLEKSDLSKSLTITEIFYSLQGESLYAGIPTVFVRTTGCPVRCTYCDTEYAFYGGKRMTLYEILEEVSRYPTPFVCVTGGEPLAQRNTFSLLSLLIARGYTVSLETSGVRPIRGLPRPLKVVLDLKTPGSGVSSAWLEENLNELLFGDELKVVVTGEEDLLWFEAWWKEHGPLPPGVILNLSPAWGLMSPRDLADWILCRGIPARLNLQLHKILWHEFTRGK
jgi:7-carboxy-7-deazaguanine synthase